MKAAFESLNTGNHSFLIRKFSERKFSAPYHFHPEYELTFDCAEEMASVMLGRICRIIFPATWFCLDQICHIAGKQKTKQREDQNLS